MKKVRLCILLLLVVTMLSFVSLCSAGAEVPGNNDTPLAVESVTLNKTELTLTVEGAPESEQVDERWLQWKDLVPPNKVWTITFNAPILRDSVNTKNVYVHSDKDKVVNISIEFSQDNKSIIINPPAGGYLPGQKYILFVKNKVKTAAGKALKKPIKMMFSVKPTGSSDVVSIDSINEDTTTVGKVYATMAGDTSLEAVRTGITMADKQLSWQQVDSSTFAVTIPGAARGQKYTFTLNAGFTLGSGVDVEVEWAQITLPFTLTSTAYSQTQLIPIKYANLGAGGQNVSIPLTWTGVPEGTKSLALIMYDLHPIADNWVHWAVINIPVTATEMPEGTSGTAQIPTGSVELNNTFGTCGYGGPQPPIGSGDHQYKTVIYALNVDQINLSGQVTQAQFESAVSEKSLGSAELTGVFFQ